MNYIDLDKTAAYKRLMEAAPAGNAFDFKKALNGERVRQYSAPIAAGLAFNWAAKAVDETILDILAALSQEQELIAKYRSLLEGEVMNTGEGRKVLHHLLRSPDGKSATGKAVLHDGRDLGLFYRAELDRFCAFADKIRRGNFAPLPASATRRLPR